MPSLHELQPWLSPWARALVLVGEHYGLGPISINSVYRSPEKQAVLYARWQRGLNDYPVAPPGKSLHEHGLAWDMNVRQGGASPEQRWLGAVWKSWGGSWSEADPIHFFVAP